MARCAVTNAQFQAFVAATGYRSDAEHFGWSYVFGQLVPEGAAAHRSPVGTSWWRVVDGASWQAPEGPGSGIGGRLDHPVVHISWNDAAAYAGWAGGRLPSEAEWEHAAKGEVPDLRFPWGDEEPDEAVIRCNIWQGTFPDHNTLRDGYLGTAPAASFQPNAIGLYNMAGNVWEWCQDAFTVRSLARAARDRNAQARREDERLLKGGSYLCHRSYCYRYRVAARSGRSRDTSAGNTGFRLAYDEIGRP